MDSNEILVSKSELDCLHEHIKNVSVGKVTAFDTDQKFHHEALQEIYETLGKLNQNMIELTNYTAAISRGELSTDFPSRSNFLAAGLKELHSSLLHLTWKVKQVSDGNYHEKIDFLGQLSDAFNDMVMRLNEREERIQELQHIIEVISTNTNIIIIVLDCETNELIYGNKGKYEDHLQHGTEAKMESMDYLIKVLKNHPIKMDGSRNGWDIFSDKTGIWYHVDAFSLVWKQGKNAIFYILVDISTQKLQIDTLEFQISIDQMTKTHNHTFAINKLEELIKEKVDFCICFMDLDGLKSANDNYGHSWGDKYILKFVDLLQSVSQPSDILCRMGGDEFLMICLDRDEYTILSVMYTLVKNVIAFNVSRKFPFNISFSFGIEHFDVKRHTDSKSILKVADQKMYIQKKEKYRLKNINKA